MAADPLDALRSLMASYSPPLDALVVPSEDNHQAKVRTANVKANNQKSIFGNKKPSSCPFS
ncbi:hypothetical protein KSP39_PZI019691 [Platanthera zijinensis]|uniref:Uncharacterized protein n=1 Tax=Platanthera zijinensis TaxID=2320716 RepID=A0AAP0B134_9ASPA